MFFISALEAGQNALTKQILPQLHLQEMVQTQIVYVMELLIVICSEEMSTVSCDHKFVMLRRGNLVVSPDP